MLKTTMLTGLSLLALLAACSGKAVIDDPAAGGQSSTTSSTSSSSTNNPTTSTTTASNPNTKPPPPPPGCISCAEFINGGGGEPDDVCPESMDVLQALGNCVCGEDEAGPCIKQCPVSCGVGDIEDFAECQNCASNECPTQVQACLNDN